MNSKKKRLKQISIFFVRRFLLVQHFEVIAVLHLLRNDVVQELHRVLPLKETIKIHLKRGKNTV